MRSFLKVLPVLVTNEREESKRHCPRDKHLLSAGHSKDQLREGHWQLQSFSSLPFPFRPCLHLPIFELRLFFREVLI